MSHHRYLIVGGGIAADAAARGIRSVDTEGSIGLVGDEADPPYDRPPLSKGLWKGKPLDEVWRGTGELGVDLQLGRRVQRIDPDEGKLTDDRGTIRTFEKLLLATGGRPRGLKDGVPQVIAFRTLADYRRLRRATETGRSFAVIGGGFIGPEMAASLAGAGKRVTLLFPEEGIGAALFPESLSLRLNDLFRERGVDVRAGAAVASVRRSGDRMLVAAEAADGPRDRAIRPEDVTTLRADAVVAGLGIVPNQEIGETAGIECASAGDGKGILVNERLRTNHERVWAAGDVASVWCPALGRRVRSEHEDHANATGYHAGRAMAGATEAFDHLPYFYSDVFDVAWEAVGELDPVGSTVVEDWKEEGRRGVLYYVREGRVRGVLLWNVRGKLKEARALVRAEARRSNGSLRGAIRVE